MRAPLARARQLAAVIVAAACVLLVAGAPGADAGSVSPGIRRTVECRGSGAQRLCLVQSRPVCRHPQPIPTRGRMGCRGGGRSS